MQADFKKQLMARRRARGVAMVEAGILAPIFAMMMMLTIYLGGVYKVKYQSFMDARFHTWYNASNNCDPDGAAESVPGFQPPPEAGQGPSSSVDADSQSGASASWGISHGTASVTWSYAPTIVLFNKNQDKTVTTESWTMCNNRKYGKNVFSYIWQSIKGLIPF